MLPSPSTQTILIMTSAIIPASIALLAELHLIFIRLLALCFDSGVVDISFFAAGFSLTHEDEEEGEEEEGYGCAAAAVDCELGGLGEGGPFLSGCEDGGFGFYDVFYCS